MNPRERVLSRSVALPTPYDRAFFPNKEINNALAHEVLDRAGQENLVYALQYGSHVTGDADPTSIHDVMIVVEVAEKFHKENLKLRGADYAFPHSARWHTYLNTFGFNFYQTHFRGENNQVLRAKLAVISKDNFIKGCSGTFSAGAGESEGAFGLYVAGRIQKAALSPLFRRENESTVEIESAINVARIDGVWFTLGLLEKQFSYDELLHMYVSLSYKADVRVEKRGKVETLIEKSRDDYAAMLNPIIESFVKGGLIERNGDGFEKVKSLPKKDVSRRLNQMKTIAFLTNYLKNPLTAGLANGLWYALQKVRRSADSYLHPEEPNHSNIM